MSTDGIGGREGMTLAFSLSAVERLADPEAAFDDAKRWSQYLGVVDDDVDAVERTVETYDLQQDFDLGDRDVWLAMDGIRESTRTPRHVYVGRTAEDRQVATQLGWEFLSVTEAAEKAEWTLAGEEASGGVFARLRRAVRDGLRAVRSE